MAEPDGDLIANLQEHARRIDELIASGVEPLALEVSDGSSMSQIDFTVDLTGSLTGGAPHVQLAGKVLPAWGGEPLDIDDVVLQHLRKGLVVAEISVGEGTGLFQVFEARVLEVLEANPSDD